MTNWRLYTHVRTVQYIHMSVLSSTRISMRPRYMRNYPKLLTKMTEVGTNSNYIRMNRERKPLK